MWAKVSENIRWLKPWDQLLKWDPPYAQWFLGGKLNAADNCLDRHVDGGLGEKTALLWEGERGETATYTYRQLLDEVCRFSNVLKALGTKKGDRIAIYMPMIPQAIIAMLSCARIGAVHTVVFAGFSSVALKDRIQDADASILITADGGFRRGKLLPLKEAADEALQECPTVEKVLVVQHAQNSVSMQKGRDHWYHEEIAKVSSTCPVEPMDSEDLLYILYTSGTTGKPKGIVHTTGGYMVQTTESTRLVFDVKPTDIYWCTADIGWVTGHSYIVYGPLSNGLTVFIYEGAADYPEKDRNWKLIEKYRITLLYTAPTAIRTFMKWGEEWLKKSDLSTLRILGSVGEPINPEAWLWYALHVGQNRCPVVDTWWQTETGSIVISPLPGKLVQKPGSATKPLPGMEVAVLNAQGEKVSNGLLAITSPWPSMLRGIYKDPVRYEETYWKKWDNRFYFSGDGARIDEDGDYWLLGRVDDVINVSGHRIGTAEVEHAIVGDKNVAEAAAIGISHPIKGQAIAVFVTLKEGRKTSEEQRQALLRQVEKEIGPFARPEKIIFIYDLPKTRSGKIMRRLLRDIAEGRVLGDVSTLSDPAVIDSVRTTYLED